MDAQRLLRASPYSSLPNHLYFPMMATAMPKKMNNVVADQLWALS
jgi:hypothetical protein